VSAEVDMRERYASCTTYEDSGTCTLVLVGADGQRRQGNVLRFKTLFDRATGAFRFDLDTAGVRAVVWRTAGGPVRDWSTFARRVANRSLEHAVRRYASLSYRTAGLIPAMLVPDEVSRIDASRGWTYARETKLPDGYMLSTDDDARTAWLDPSFTLRRMSIRDLSVMTDYATTPTTRKVTTVTATILYTPSFDAPLEAARFWFEQPPGNSGASG
jgi:hypothetical protein